MKRRWASGPSAGESAAEIPSPRFVGMSIRLRGRGLGDVHLEALAHPPLCAWRDDEA